MYPGYTYCCTSRIHIMDQMSLNYMILNACTVDTHTAVDPGNNLWASDVFKLYDLTYMYSGYTYCCRPWIHFISRCLKNFINLNTCTLDTHAVVDPGYTLWTSCRMCIQQACISSSIHIMGLSCLQCMCIHGTCIQ